MVSIIVLIDFLLIYIILVYDELYDFLLAELYYVVDENLEKEVEHSLDL